MTYLLDVCVIGISDLGKLISAKDKYHKVKSYCDTVSNDLS